jgi:hypothetical protein
MSKSLGRKKSTRLALKQLGMFKTLATVMKSLNQYYFPNRKNMPAATAGGAPSHPPTLHSLFVHHTNADWIENKLLSRA